MEQMELFAARNARDEGMERVLTKAGDDWSAQARKAFLRVIPNKWEGMGEDIRLAVIKEGVPEPHSPNVWGPYINGLRKSGLIVPIGYKQPRCEKSHASEKKLYRRCG